MRDSPHILVVVMAAGLVIGVGAGGQIAEAGYGTEALVACGVLLVLVLARYLWLGFVLREPIRQLAESADRIARGDLAVRVPRRASGDLHALVLAFRRMVTRLRRTTLSRDDLDRVVGSVNCGLCVIGPDGRVRTANAQAAAMFARPDTSLRGVAFASLLAAPFEDFGAWSADRFGEPAEVDLARAGTGPLPVLLSLSRIDGRADVVCVMQRIGNTRDVEAQMQRVNVQLWLLNHVTTIALRTRELTPTLNQIADALHGSGAFAGVGFALRDPDPDVLRMASVAGFEPGCVGTAERRDGAVSLLWQVVAQGEPIILHLEGSELELGDPLLGTLRAAVLGAFPMRIEGRVIGVAVLASDRLTHDVAEFGRTGVDLAQHVAALVDQKLASEALRRSNQELELARLAAEDANRAKSEFLANMSHEIRTPMTAILGYADLVREQGADPRETAEFLATIRRNGEHLMSIVNDILDLSKIEAGKMALEVVPCSPAQIAQQVAELLRRRAADRGIQLETRFEWPLPRVVLSDPTRLRQILVNLLGNAIKFTEQGEITLTVRRQASRPTAIVFDVTDTGIGMTARELALLFKPFSQGDSSHSRRFGGTGLGLAISQRIAVLLGGSISVQSRKHSGSTFSLEIDGGAPGAGPVVDSLEATAETSLVDAPARRRGDARRSVDARVLLAEDGVDNQRLVAHLLRKVGARVEVVADGRAAVDAVFAATAVGTPFDVVLMDMQMPILDGYAATRELRGRGYSGPIVALTAHAMEGDADKCLAAGCDGYLSKPIDRVGLLETVATMAERSASVGGPAAGSADG